MDGNSSTSAFSLWALHDGIVVAGQSGTQLVFFLAVKKSSTLT